MFRNVFEAARTQTKTVNVSLTIIIVYLFTVWFTGGNLYGGVRLTSVRETPVGTLVDGEAKRPTACKSVDTDQFPRVSPDQTKYGPWVVSDGAKVKCRWIFLDLPKGDSTGL